MFGSSAVSNGLTQALFLTRLPAAYDGNQSTLTLQQGSDFLPTPGSGQSHEPLAMTPAAGGGVWVAYTDGDNDQLRLRRYREDGTLDTSIGNNGTRTLGNGYPEAQDTAVVAGFDGNQRLYLYQATPDGYHTQTHELVPRAQYESLSGTCDRVRKSQAPADVFPPTLKALAEANGDLFVASNSVNLG